MHFWQSESIYLLLIKLPVITNVRRLCVDQESWKTLEAVLGTSLDVETLTLSFLEEIDIISHATKIQEVTNQLRKTNFWPFPLIKSYMSKLKVKHWDCCMSACWAVYFTDRICTFATFFFFFCFVVFFFFFYLFSVLYVFLDFAGTIKMSRLQDK